MNGLMNQDISFIELQLFLKKHSVWWLILLDMFLKVQKPHPREWNPIELQYLFV